MQPACCVQEEHELEAEPGCKLLAAGAARHWRLRAQQLGAPAFQGLRVRARSLLPCPASLALIAGRPAWHSNARHACCVLSIRACPSHAICTWEQ
jgi:hypothetical protein